MNVYYGVGVAYPDGSSPPIAQYSTPGTAPSISTATSVVNAALAANPGAEVVYLNFRNVGP